MLDDLLKNITAFKNTIEDRGLDIVVKNKKKITNDFLWKNQLSKGKNSFSKPIKHPFNSIPGKYSPTTQNFRQPPPKKPKVPFANYNFEWTGDTFAGLDVKKERGGFVIFTHDFKNLEQIYSTKLYDLSPQSESLVNNKIVLPELIEQFLDSEIFSNL